MSTDPMKLPDPPMPYYTLTIYNLDLFEKSKFKDYDSLLESRLASCQARANHLASILENGNAISANGTLVRPQGEHESKGAREKVPVTTSTHFIGQYVASFTIGTEQVKSYLVIDTGSDLVWWQCGPCYKNGCYKQKNNPLYVSTNSKTYRKLDCLVESRNCEITNKVYECSPYGNTCIYDYKYVGGPRTRGWIAHDVVTFVLDQKQVSIVFGCGKDQMHGEPFSAQFSGIAGMGRRVMGGGNSLPSQFEADIISMCLPGALSTKGSTLSFHKTPFKKTTSATLLQDFRFPSFYFVNLYEVFINDREVPMFQSLSRNFGNYTTRGSSIVDTGTFITRFPQDFYTVFSYTFRLQVRGIPMIDVPPGSVHDTCYKVNTTGPDPHFPVVKLYFGSQNPNNLLLLTQQRVMQYINGVFCLAFLPWDQTVALIGSNQLQGIGLTFDTAANTLSFDVDACN
ncbi:hypothetical protein CQW23_16183 [Capsicum baccatum]|uniref:Peptidase A1 domain-containing protein n=1 Tax=Capsicum baccatum TaxID=33114 RepID=A0A2G2WA90_CAPBA|nr:hypothetical protein CQW23_16183 [Capsicum baccatum]